MDLTEDGATVQQILDIGDTEGHIEGHIKAESTLTDVGVKVLWSNGGDSQLGTFEIIQESNGAIKSECSVDGSSLGQDDMVHAGNQMLHDHGDQEDMVHAGNQMLHDDGDSLGATEGLTHQQVTEANNLLNGDDISEGHMLHVPETDGEMLSNDPSSIQVTTEGHMLHVPETDGSMLHHDPSSIQVTTEGHMLHVPETDGSMLHNDPSSIQVATSLATELTANSDQDVIQLLLPQGDDGLHTTVSLQSMGLNLGSVAMTTSQMMSPTPTVQAITLADGTTAFIQHPNGKFLEGQTITLEDGSTAIVQGIPNKLSTVNLVTSLPNTGGMKSELIDTTTVQSVQLEDGTTGFLNHAVKDGLQAIILEDGTTAYLATQQTPGFIDNTQLEPTTLTLDQLTSSVSGVHTLLSNGMVNVDVKTLALPPNQTVMTNGTELQQHQGTVVKPTNLVTNNHLDKTGPYLEKMYKCSYDACGRYYTTLHHLRVHERTHTGDRPFRCEFAGCGKAFATGYGLKSHIRVHTGEKPYKCPEGTCDKAFKTSGDLQKHVRTHTGERPFKCPFEGCTRSFTTSNIRKVHIRTHTGERPYTCPEEGCARAFASATNYKNHIRIHTGEKPYVCTVQGCGKRFTEYSSLYKHHVVHTHAKPYTCNRCGKTYRQTSTLAMHKRTTHGEEVTAESEAVLFQEQTHVDGQEPPDKRARLAFSMGGQADLEEEGTLVINTSDPGQQLTFVGADSLANTDLLQQQTSSLVNTSQNAQNALLQQAGVATFTLGDQGQQVYVITDPAQLEALQQIAQHQFDSETLDTSSLITTLPSSEVTTLEPSDVTMVTEIRSANELTDDPVSINTASITDISAFQTDT